MRPLSLLALALFSLGAFTAACSGETATESPDDGSGATGATGHGHGGDGADGSGGTGARHGRGGNGAGNGTGGLGGDACATESAEATTRTRPVDIIFLVDNSGSMSNEINTVEANINENFARIIQESGVDYRVIMISRHGNSEVERICVRAPLSSVSCEPLPNQPGLSERFFHYSIVVNSWNSLCQALDGYDGKVEDDFGFAPNGWSEWLREGALKVFVELTDDRVRCGAYDDKGSPEQVAADFEAALYKLSPSQFGTPEQRNFVFHSIVGLAGKAGGYTAADPIQTERCNGAVNSGRGYQALSILTGGMRFPICSTESYDAVFREIATGVIEGASVPCSFALPTPPEGSQLDLSRVAMEYTPGSGAAPERLTRAADANACTASSFYLEGEVIRLCPDACARVQADESAKLRTLIECSAILQ